MNKGTEILCDSLPRYIVLVNFTDQGIGNIRESPKRAEAGRKLAEKYGGRLQVYYAMGEYDGVYVAEMPSDEVMTQYLLALASLGNVRTKTLKVWTETEAADLISKLPQQAGCANEIIAPTLALHETTHAN